MQNTFFGVDTNFWVTRDNVLKNKYVLAIGNDKARDWETLNLGTILSLF